MAQAQLTTVLRHLRRLRAAPAVADLSDAQLVERFAARRDGDAFAALVQRHGRLVWAVCRQVLGHEHDAEDAFQATFFVLARQAAAIRAGQAVGSWLYHVAYRTALRAGAARARRDAHERQVATMGHGQPGCELAWRELQAVLDDELRRLPEKYRAPFVLCCLEGKTKPEAARQLGWKEGTVSGRLAQARKQLQRRLARRGVTLSAVLGASALALEASAAPAGLARAAVHGALLYAAGPAAAGGAVPAEVAALAEGVTRTMFATKVKLATAVFLAVGLLVAGTGLVTHQALAARQGGSQSPEELKSALQGKAPAAKARPEAVKDDKEDTLEVKGHVFGPDGKPFPGAKLRIGDKVYAESDKDGAFRFPVSKAEFDKDSSGKGTWVWAAVLATADGHAPDWRELGRRDKDGNLTLRLAKDVPVVGRLLDLEGRPVAGATVRVVRLGATPDNDLTHFLKVWKEDPWFALTGARYVARPVPVKEGKELGKELPGVEWRRLWPDTCKKLFPPVTTDKDGKFKLTGLGGERLVEFVVSGPAAEQLELRALTRDGLDAKELNKPNPEYAKLGGRPFPPLVGATFEQLVGPTKPVVGVVKDKATGKPVAGVRIVGRAYDASKYSNTDIDTLTDEKGAYRLVGLPKDREYSVVADTTKGEVYLPQEKALDDTEGLKPLTADFELERGIVVEGRLVDKATGKPVGGRVAYLPLPGNTHFRAGRGGGLLRYVEQPRFARNDDGAFKLVVYPGPGVVFASADHGQYLPALISPEDKKKGLEHPFFVAGRYTSFQAQAYQVIEPDEKAESLKVELEFVAGRKLTGSIEGPDGKPLTGAAGGGVLPREDPLAQALLPAVQVDKDAATFTATNVDPRRPQHFVFYHADKKLAACVEMKGDAKGPLTVRLQPWGTVTGTLLDPDGQPLADADVRVNCQDAARRQLMLGHQLPFAKPVKTDKDGKFTIEGFVPGLQFDLVVVTAAKKGEPPTRVVHAFRELTWKAGEAKGLGAVKTKPVGKD